MQVTGIVGAAALLALLSAITLVVVRGVIEPIRATAATSRRLAAGDLGVRMPENGEDELATLAASFNGMADSLQARIRELAELSVMQQRFVSDVSHELRTPLTTIRLAGDVLYGQRDDFPGPTSRTVELLHTQTDRFERLLADLLEISRYDAGSVTLTTEPTNLVHLAGDAIESMHELAREQGCELRLDAPGGHLDAEVDPRRIRRIVRNLLGNAIEHGEGRPIVVAVDSNETAIALSVRDYGLGMSEEETARVFDRFWRADPSRTRTIGGTGLGLAISLEDAVAHGGMLDVWSQPGEGTVFRLTLPRTSDAAAVVSPLPLEPSTPVRTGPRPRARSARCPASTRARGRCTMRRRLAAAAASVALLALLLAGCATIPSSGPVQQGDPVPADSSPDLDIVVEGPTADATQEQILEGFLNAAQSPRNNYQVAREYLTPTFADEWQADAAATIDVLADREREVVGRDDDPGRRHARRVPPATTASTRSPIRARPSRSTTGSSRSRGSGASRARRRASSSTR